VVFRNAMPLDTTGDDLADGTATGTYVNTGDGGADPACTVDPGFFPAQGWMRLVDDSDLSDVMPLDGSVDIWVRPLGRFDVLFDCPADTSHPGVSLVMPTADDAVDDKGNIKMGYNPFDIKFNLPRDVIGMGYVEQLDPAKTIEGVTCPGYIAEQTTNCRLQWSAKVKLTKIWEKPSPSSATPSPGPTTQQQQPTPPPPAKPPATKPPVVDDDDLLLPLVPANKVSLNADGSKASFSVSCAAGCSGSASLTAGAGGAHARSAAAANVLARVRFTVAAGATKKVTIKLGAKARRAVRKARGARIAVRTSASGRTSTRTLTVRLRAPRAGRR
jgi:hypothetical protein